MHPLTLFEPCTTVESFQREFDKFGRVDDVFITGKGYAFVTMEDIEDAKDAIKELNGATIDGQEVKVE